MITHDPDAISLDRIKVLVDNAFEESVKGAAQAAWFKLAGKVDSLDGVMQSFERALTDLEQLRTAQLKAVDRRYGH
jgi:hypothetical protein